MASEQEQTEHARESADRAAAAAERAKIAAEKANDAAAGGSETAQRAALEARRAAHRAGQQADAAKAAAEAGELEQARQAAAAAEQAAADAEGRAAPAADDTRAAAGEPPRTSAPGEERAAPEPAHASERAAGGATSDEGDEEAAEEAGQRGAPALYLAEFETPEACLHAAEHVRDAGYESWDVHTPYPVHGMEDAMGLKTTKLGVLAFAAAMTGLAAAVLMIQYMNNWDYPLIVGGKPPGAFPSMVPIMFELTILLTGLGTVVGLLHMARLPRHHHPIFNSDRFAAASDDKFFISIEASDRYFDVDKTRDFLESLEPSHVELVEEEEEPS